MPEYTFKKYRQEELIAGINKNDPALLKWLYQSQYPKVERYVVANHGDHDQAKDIYQEAFLAVWKKIKSADFVVQNSTAVTGYLYKVAKNKWLDQISVRKKQQTVSLEGRSDVSDEEPTESQEPYFKLLWSQFQTMGENCQEILRRFYFQKQNMGEIARHFSWTEATARNNKYRCIQKLREKIKKEAENQQDI